MTTENGVVVISTAEYLELNASIGKLEHELEEKNKQIEKFSTCACVLVEKREFGFLGDHVKYEVKGYDDILSKITEERNGVEKAVWEQRKEILELQSKINELTSNKKRLFKK